MTPRTDIASLSLGPVRVTLSYLAEYNNLSRSEYVRRLLMREENRVLDAEARRKRAESKKHVPIGLWDACASAGRRRRSTRSKRSGGNITTSAGN